jgi:hypothetical protein
MKQAKQYFDNHNAVEQLYFTSDHLAFFDEQNAINHARQLDDQAVTSMTREEADQAVNDLAEGNWNEEDLFDEFETE